MSPFDEDFGTRLSARIQNYVRRRVEEPLERAFSDVDALADRAAKRPEKIAKKLEDD
jgi:hypothetical protein